MTKAAKVANHLMQHKNITSWEAITKYRVTRLADVIFKLKNRGWLISTVMIEGKDNTRFARYILLRAPKNA